MKAQELIVSCYYTNDGAPIQDIVSSSFTTFLKKELEKYGINVTIRREMGRDIDGACGQLRRRYLKSGEPGEEGSDAESLGHEGHREMP